MPIYFPNPKLLPKCLNQLHKQLVEDWRKPCKEVDVSCPSCQIFLALAKIECGYEDMEELNKRISKMKL